MTLTLHDVWKQHKASPKSTLPQVIGGGTGQSFFTRGPNTEVLVSSYLVEQVTDCLKLLYPIVSRVDSSVLTIGSKLSLEAKPLHYALHNFLYEAKLEEAPWTAVALRFNPASRHKLQDAFYPKKLAALFLSQFLNPYPDGDPTFLDAFTESSGLPDEDANHEGYFEEEGNSIAPAVVFGWLKSVIPHNTNHNFLFPYFHEVMFYNTLWHFHGAAGQLCSVENPRQYFFAEDLWNFMRNQVKEDGVENVPDLQSYLDLLH